MVAIISRISKVIVPILLIATQVAKGEPTYKELMAQNGAMERKVDSLTRLINDGRASLSNAGDKRSQIEGKIMEMEMEMFDLRAAQSQLATKLGTMQQGAVSTSNNSATTTANDSKQISKAPIVANNLPKEDYENLQYAEEDEAECAKLFSEYITTYSRLRELRQLYDQAKTEEEAIKFEEEFEPMIMQADSLSGLLSDTWGEIYDNKSFAYSMAIELLGEENLMNQQTELAQQSAAKIAEVEHGEQSRAALHYDYQKREILALELLIAKKLNMPNAVDSLQSVEKLVAKTPAVMDLSEVEFKRRNFILYEPIKFVTATPYNTTTNKIPMAEEYKQGVIYRIQLGAYKYEQLPTIFRGTTPLSRDRALGFWTYYGGGFETQAEANAAVKLLMRRGFKRPEVVRWLNGVRRNLYRDPLPKSENQRVVISGITTLTEQMEGAIKGTTPDANLAKTGANKFIVSPISGRESAEQLVDKLKAINADINYQIIEVE